MYVGAASEGEATAIAAGAWLAGRRTVMMCQNYGLGNAINPLTSLNRPFRIPTLIIVTWRGQPGLKDEPQHAMMGRITGTLLDGIGVPHAPFPKDPSDVRPALDAARAAMDETGLPYAFIMEKGSVASADLEQAPAATPGGGRLEDLTTGGERPTRFAALERVLESAPESGGLIATTG